MANSSGTTRNNRGARVEGSAITAPLITRASNAQIELVKYRAFVHWEPKIGDFVIWHGWLWRWYGVINAVYNDKVSIITEGLPILLFTLNEEDYGANTKDISIGKIRNSKGGEFHILQNGTWYING